MEKQSVWQVNTEKYENIIKSSSLVIPSNVGVSSFVYNDDLTVSNNRWRDDGDEVGPAPMDYDSIWEFIKNKFSEAPTVKHECYCCGGTLEIDANKHIFHCPYCHSVYAIGTKMINAGVG